MSKLLEIKDLIEKQGYEIISCYYAYRYGLTVSLVKTMHGDLGKRKTIHISFDDEDFGEIWSYVNVEKS